MVKDDARFLLCRPKGGIADTVAQIARCCQYATRYHRQLIVDATGSGLKDTLSNYIAHPHIKDLNATLAAKLGRLSIVPGVLGLSALSRYAVRYRFLKWLRAIPRLTNRLTYRITYKQKTFCEKRSHTRLSFTFSRDYQEAVLVHHQDGTITDKNTVLSFFNTITLAGAVQKDICSRLTTLVAQPYSAIHIRNTDLTSNYIDLCNSLAPTLRGKRVLLCSDSRQALIGAKAILVHSDVLYTNSRASEDGTPLHAMHKTYGALTGNDRYQLNCDVLTDLFALSLATERHSAETNNQSKQSGFAVLAEILAQNPDTVRRLLPEISPRN